MEREMGWLTECCNSVSFTAIAVEYHVQDRQFRIPSASCLLQFALRWVRLGIAAAHWFPSALRTLVRTHADASHAMSPMIALYPRAKLWKHSRSPHVFPIILRESFTQRIHLPFCAIKYCTLPDVQMTEDMTYHSHLCNWRWFQFEKCRRQLSKSIRWDKSRRSSRKLSPVQVPLTEMSIENERLLCDRMLQLSLTIRLHVLVQVRIFSEHN